MFNVLIIIPALNPDNKLIEYVSHLKEAGENNILVVDDGSDEKCNEIFEFLKNEADCILLRHAVNMGKGRSLKDAFNFYLTNFEPTYGGVITVDADGQHSVEDVLKMKEALNGHQSSLIIGTRDFGKKNVPRKSSMGNIITRSIVKILYGGNITDTQSGLRAIPNIVLPKYLTLQGERFEYETGMLIETLQSKIPIFEVSIETIYFEENKETHFRPIVDSWKIYRLIFSIFFKYVLSSTTASIIDLCLFQIIVWILGENPLYERVWIATICARVVSSIVNYFTNRNLVFSDTEKGVNTLVKYYILCICQMALSALLVSVGSKMFVIPEITSKVITDTILFFISFRIQKKIVFCNPR